MGIDDGTRIILGSLRNKVSPNVDMMSNVALEQTQRENIEFDRTADVNLQQLVSFRLYLKTIMLDQQITHHLKIIYIILMRYKMRLVQL